MKKSRKEQLAADLRDRYRRHAELLENGGNDPFYPDGVDLELVRNHIIYYKRQCEEELHPSDYPEEYYWDLPPEVDRAYMAHPERIYEQALKSLEVYENDPDYMALRGIAPDLTEKQRERSHIDAVLNYVTGLRRSIDSCDLVTMRRHRDPEWYRESFSACHKMVLELTGENVDNSVLPEGQLSIFDLFCLTV